MRTGKILQVVGPVVDVVFPLEEGVPDIHNALQVVKQQVTEVKRLLHWKLL